jgi:L,D-transpeptidase ErfK/SrfK
VKKIFIFFLVVLNGVSLTGLFCTRLFARNGAYRYLLPAQPFGVDSQEVTVIGALQTYTIQEDDTLLDIARNFDLGFLEVQAPYKEMDPWVPPVGYELTIPTLWVLPEGEWDGILINIPEMRLYLFFQKIAMVKTYPIGIGVTNNFTPVGRFYIKEKRIEPTWHIPPSIRKEYEGKKSIPPGPDNPLGSYWLGLSINGYGIHGTNIPWAVGRLVTHGCIRLYPEDIQYLYPTIRLGTPVNIIYDPFKIGFKKGRIFFEVHEDIYHRIPDPLSYVLKKLDQKGIQNFIELEKVKEALLEKSGIPVDITSGDVITENRRP